MRVAAVLAPVVQEVAEERTEALERMHLEEIRGRVEREDII